MKCPVCPQSTLTISERQGIEIDYCPTCRGVWLDRGELDKIIERSAGSATAYASAPQPAPAAPRPRYDDDRRDEGYRHRKRKSFLDDIFDF